MHQKSRFTELKIHWRFNNRLPVIHNSGNIFKFHEIYLTLNLIETTFQQESFIISYIFQSKKIIPPIEEGEVIVCYFLLSCR